MPAGRRPAVLRDCCIAGEHQSDLGDLALLLVLRSRSHGLASAFGREDKSGPVVQMDVSGATRAAPESVDRS
jgi:hypothetical protein